MSFYLLMEVKGRRSQESKGSKLCCEVGAHIMTWRRRCRDRWSDREKERSHSVQRNGLIPVCLRKCRVSSSERAKRQVQPSQVQWYGFSPGGDETQQESGGQATGTPGRLGPGCGG